MYYKHCMLSDKNCTQPKTLGFEIQNRYLAYISKLSAKTTGRFFINKV